jgi:hypothetical protein
MGIAHRNGHLGDADFGNQMIGNSLAELAGSTGDKNHVALLNLLGIDMGDTRCFRDATNYRDAYSLEIGDNKQMIVANSTPNK